MYSSIHSLLRSGSDAFALPFAQRERELVEKKELRCTTGSKAAGTGNEIADDIEVGALSEEEVTPPRARRTSSSTSKVTVTARQRLAEMQRESDEAKAKAYGRSTTESTAPDAALTPKPSAGAVGTCLLYTSDAADE